MFGTLFCVPVNIWRVALVRAVLHLGLEQWSLQFYMYMKIVIPWQAFIRSHVKWCKSLPCSSERLCAMAGLREPRMSPQGC
jgi:hypothetical protein